MSFFLNLRGQRSPTRLRRSKTSVDAFRVRGWDRPVARTVGFRLTKNGAIKDQMFKASLLIASVRKNFMSDLRFCLDNNSSNFKQILEMRCDEDFQALTRCLTRCFSPWRLGQEVALAMKWSVLLVVCRSVAGRDHPDTLSNPKQSKRNRTEFLTLKLDCFFFYHVVISAKDILQHWIEDDEDVCSSDCFFVDLMHVCYQYVSIFWFSEQCPGGLKPESTWPWPSHWVVFLKRWSAVAMPFTPLFFPVGCLANVTSLMISQKSP